MYLQHDHVLNTPVASHCCTWCQRLQLLIYMCIIEILFQFYAQNVTLGRADVSHVPHVHQCLRETGIFPGLFLFWRLIRPPPLEISFTDSMHASSSLSTVFHSPFEYPYVKGR